MKVLIVGKRLVSADQIAFVEPVDPSSNPEFKLGKDSKARVVLLSPNVVLIEQSSQEFGVRQGLHLRRGAYDLNPGWASR